MAMPTSPEIIELERIASIIISAHQLALQLEDLFNPVKFVSDISKFQLEKTRADYLVSTAKNLLKYFEDFISYDFKFFNPNHLSNLTSMREELMFSSRNYDALGFDRVLSRDDLQILILWIDKEFKEYYADIINRISCAF